MKKKAFGLLVVALLFIPGLWQSAQAQGGGCPVEPARAWIGDWGEQVLLSPGIPEGVPQDAARGVFDERQVEVKVDPTTQRVIISSTQFEDLCVDDAFDLSVLPTGVTWRLDFRAEGGIEPRHPVDITAMFMAGEGAVTIKHIDLVRPQASASPIWLSIIPRDQRLPKDVQIDIWEAAQPTVAWVPTPTLSPSPSVAPTASPTASPSPIPAAKATSPPLPTPSAVPEVVAAPPIDDTGRGALPIPWPIMPLTLIVPGGLAIWLWKRSQSQAYPQGDTEIDIDGQPLPGMEMPIGLAGFKKPVVRAGGGLDCDIRVPGADVPPILVQFRAERNQFGQVETLLDRFDPASQEVVETFLLGHGDRVSIHPITVTYTNCAEQEPIIIEGGYFHA
jgi:hypothetical protein